MRYFVHIGYHGTNYSGWQKHAGALTVQQVLETALSQIFKTTIAINGCGRTDAHVHAAQFFFHMDVDAEWGFDLAFRLNKILPYDIAVFDVVPVNGLPHARFDAIQRTYDYFIHTYKDPFLNRFSSLYPDELNLQAMASAVALLPLYNNYRAFCKTPDKNEHTICNVTTALLYASADGSRIRFHISANRFLGKMIRIIVGRLLDIGTGKLSLAAFERYLTHPDVPQTITPAYPQGLYLSKITYPYLNLPPRSQFVNMLQFNTNTVWQPVKHK
ncbi:tRNA pseudouridine(38-40) synthase [Mucilaginibacter gracilis]|uniref:tRNA pseudouridine synthase A n=1 Tax=Mucilaginibacter gracilis TaxID=423350 RepID=A0A495J931_9SPHI|nr:tRNA pseudouridine synthase A [Mucilaginibacter gracilis]RKR84988.1 tRNA pseudouridine(38-40) synthase [Mucilaginibacter gracilis]